MSWNSETGKVTAFGLDSCDSSTEMPLFWGGDKSQSCYTSKHCCLLLPPVDAIVD
jgi:hypothetical protein